MVAHQVSMNVVRLCKRKRDKTNVCTRGYRTNDMARFIFFINGRLAALKGVYSARKKERKKNKHPKRETKIKWKNETDRKRYLHPTDRGTL